MTRFVKERPWAVWCLFLAGAVTGGVSSSLMGPHRVLADPANLNGQKFADLQKQVAVHDALLDGMTRGESGGFFFSNPVHANKLVVECTPDSTGPVLSVCGQSLFTGDPGPDDPLVRIDPLMIYPKPELRVLGSLSAETPTKAAFIHPDRIELLGPASKAAVHLDRIELLGPAAEGLKLAVDTETGETRIRVDKAEVGSLTADDATITDAAIFDATIYNLAEGTPKEPGPF